MMKADVLTEFETIKVCTHYKLPSGEITDHVPHTMDNVGIEPVYVELPGWMMDLNQVETVEDLPKAFVNYLNFLEEYLHVPITIVSVGPDRKSTLRREVEKVS
jgi:adenylosuccinate synthase